MRRSAPHSAEQALRAAALGIFLTLLAGCQSLAHEGSFARVRVVNLSSDGPMLDVYQGTNVLAYNLSFGTVTSYVPVSPGAYTLTVDAAGSKQVLSSLKGAFSQGLQYTVLVNNAAANLQQVVLADQVPQLPSAPPSIRIIHEAARAGAVDVYFVPDGQRLGAATPVIVNLAAGVSTSYLPIPPGVSAVVLLPAGTAPSAASALHAGRQLRYSNGSARTLILVDAPPSSLSSQSDVQIITTIDTEPAS